MMSSKKRPSRNTRTGAISLDQFHIQLQHLMGGLDCHSNPLPSSSSSSSAAIGTTSSVRDIRFTEGAVLGLREIFGTYLQHVASALSNHDSLTQEETILECLAEVTAHTTTPAAAFDAATTPDSISHSGEACSSSSSIIPSSSDIQQWQTLPQQAKDLLAGVAVATQLGGSTTTTITTTTATANHDVDKHGKLSSSLQQLPVSGGTTKTIGAGAGTSSTASTLGHVAMGAPKKQQQQRKKRKRLVVTEELELEQERLLMASKKSMVEKQKGGKS